jgi:hypothetical protein
MSFHLAHQDDYNLNSDDEENVVNDENDEDFNQAVQLSLAAFDSEDEDVEEEYKSTDNSFVESGATLAELLKIVGKLAMGGSVIEKIFNLSKVMSFTTSKPSRQTLNLPESSKKIIRMYKENLQGILPATELKLKAHSNRSQYVLSNFYIQVYQETQACLVSVMRLVTLLFYSIPLLIILSILFF